MKGIEISKKFYEEFGVAMLHGQFPQLENNVAVGLVGSGSECFGYDDELSTDHDFDPGFCIFVPSDLDENLKFKLERAYAKLPRTFMEHERDVMSPVGGNRRGVKRISDFLKEKTGTEDGNLSTYDWFNIPEESLAEFTNGELWRDDSKVLTSLRLKLATFPEDIKLKKLAGELLLMAQSGQYNFERCVGHNEFGAAKLAAHEFVNAAMHAAFLLNDEYMPFYKWRFKALRNLFWPKGFRLKSELNNVKGVEDDGYTIIDFENKLEFLLSITDDKIFNDRVINEINIIAKLFVERLKSDGLTEKDDIFLEKQAYEVNNRIKDINIRNMNILVAV